MTTDLSHTAIPIAESAPLANSNCASTTGWICACGGYRGTNVWTCVCSDPPIEPAVEARLEALDRRVRSIEHRWNDQRTAIVAELAEMVRDKFIEIREENRVLKARIADLEDQLYKPSRLVP